MSTSELPVAGYSVSPGGLSSTSASFIDELALDPRFQELQTTLRTYLIDEVRSAENTRQQSPDVAIESSEDVQGHELFMQHMLKSQDRIPLMKKVKYLTVWISECAPWLDMFDQERHFGIQVPLLAQRSPAVFFALLALAARQVERKSSSKVSIHDSLELYSLAIESLATSINATDPEALVTACILCVLEMMSVSPRDWRRHLEGCAGLFQHLGVNGFSGGVWQAVFWCYARMDVCAAIIADGAESTTLPLQKWVSLDAMTTPDVDQQVHINHAFLEKGIETSDMYANYAVYLCARVCDLLAKRTRHLELAEKNGCSDAPFQKTWFEIREDLQQWFDRRPPEMLSVEEVDRSPETEYFPRILFAHSAAISGNQLYHTACILMSEIQPSQVDDGILGDSHTIFWHARRVVGISLTNPHRGCLNNAIQPLYVAGKVFTHRDEHKIIIGLLHHIETCSGWGSKWRIKDLEHFWGYSPGRSISLVRSC
ncbi:uncharacterized protein A1O9_04022 [Exophiala aquamarina CBS 119918]|uniref:Transcription factor domain-containing protein n=1 Tax=Exophiala aquamarina CBS 119918 TaxID=1182545 RepID=A0A072PIN7_9EURO|nr:uncharacterized protein A1O9_04022 [Exophiala aquamarina CBS 119918]KEF59178.1 hypothetical protein A1O9_04022 [Exophiala aquamarina CBS 119918]